MPETAAAAQWYKENTTRVQMKLMNTTDADIIEKLNSVDNKQGYIKKLIRDDIAKNNK